MAIEDEDGILAPIGAGTRVVIKGECVNSIAAAEGYAADTVWNHPSNRALKEARGNPNTLLPGDRLTLPPKDEGTRACATGRRHRFRLRGIPEKLRIEFHDDNGPRAGLDYTLIVDDQALTGTTDARGTVEQWIPPQAKTGEIRLRRAGPEPWQEEEEVYPLDLGHLEPVGSETGARARLVNLGHLDAIDSERERYRDALAAFQRLHDLDVTRLLDQRTQSKLLELHGY